MNIYTCSQEQLADLEKVGTGTAIKIVELRNSVIEGQHDPITVQDLAAARLTVEYWQELVDKNVLDINPPAGLLKPRVEVAKAKETMTDFQKLENMLDKSLKIFFNRMEKKIEDSYPLFKIKLMIFHQILTSN